MRDRESSTGDPSSEGCWGEFAACTSEEPTTATIMNIQTAEASRSQQVGIVSLGEECDDGQNDGGYGECDPGCKLGPHCGDGIVQEEEDCDDGNRFDGDGCENSCRHIVVK